jgi:hypothetical protein
MVKLGWRLELSFEGGLAWGCMGEVHPSLYRGVGGVKNYFVKMSFRKDFRIIFLEDKIRLKGNYLKRQGQGNGATGLAH